MKESFCVFMHQEFGLNEKCVPVGMSCGGMQHGGDIAQVVKPGCDHHPQGLTDNALPKEFVNRVY